MHVAENHNTDGSSGNFSFQTPAYLQATVIDSFPV